MLIEYGLHVLIVALLTVGLGVCGYFFPRLFHQPLCRTLAVMAGYFALALCLWQVVVLTQTSSLIQHLGADALQISILLGALVASGCILHSLLQADRGAGWERRPRFAKILSRLLSGLGLALVALVLVQADRDVVPSYEHKEPKRTAHELPRVAVDSALTDAGHPIPLYTVPASVDLGGYVDPSLAWIEEHYRLRLIRTAEPDVRYNCHGWVYTDGRYIISGEDVARIVQDNGYQVVAAPVPGDLVIYFSDEGLISHTGRVRAIEEDGTVLVESKWGCVGARYLHRLDVWPDSTYAFFHTSRPTHVLRDLPASASR